MFLLKQIKLKLNLVRSLPQTYEGTVEEAEKAFEAGNYTCKQKDFYRLFASFLQHSDPNQDVYSPYALEAWVKKQISNQQAFYLIAPKQREKDLQNEAAAEAAGAETPVVPEAQKSGV